MLAQTCLPSLTPGFWVSSRFLEKRESTFDDGSCFNSRKFFNTQPEKADKHGGWGGGLKEGHIWLLCGILYRALNASKCGGGEGEDGQTDRQGGKRAWGRLEQAPTLWCRKPVRQCPCGWDGAQNSSLHSSALTPTSCAMRSDRFFDLPFPIFVLFLYNNICTHPEKTSLQDEVLCNGDYHPFMVSCLRFSLYFCCLIIYP